MGLNLEDDLDFNSNSLADDLENFVKTEAEQSENVTSFNQDELEQSSDNTLSFSQDESGQSEEDNIDLLLDDTLNQIFGKDSDDVEQVVDDQDVEEHYEEDDVNLESVVDDSTYAEIVYPCLLLNGASTNEEVEFLKSFSTEESDSKAIYLYCEADQGVCEIGYIKLTLKFLLTLSRMPGYRLFSLYSNTSKRNEIKLDDPKVLSNFISL